MDINLTANWRLIRTLDPLLQRSNAGRAVFVTSGAASGQHAYWGPYAVSKAGLEALARTYAHEVANTAVRVNLVNPGPLRTGMRAKAFPGENQATLPIPTKRPRCLSSSPRPTAAATASASTSAPGARRARQARRARTSADGEVDHHAVVGGLDVGGQLAAQRVVVEIARHVREDAALRLYLLDPLDRLPYSKMAGVGRVAQSIDDPHVEALEQRQRGFGHVADVGRIGDRPKRNPSETISPWTCGIGIASIGPPAPSMRTGLPSMISWMSRMGA